MAKYTLPDAFKLNGTWWLPSNSTEHLRGTITYTPGERINLELQGEFHHSDLEATQPVLDIILGITENGYPCTLIDNYLISSQRDLSYSNLTAIQHYEPLCVLYGEHFNTKKNINFSEMSIEFQELESWMDNGTIPFTMGETTSGLHEIHLTYSTPALLKIDLWQLETSIYLRANAIVLALDYYSRGIQHHNMIQIRPYQDKHWSWFRQIIFDIKNLLTLLVGQSAKLRKIQAIVKGNFEENDNLIHIYISEIDKPSAPIIHPGKVLIPLSVIKSNLSQVVNNWFVDTNIIRPVIDLFFGLLESDRSYDRFAFLGLAQALESFHRSTENGGYIDESTHLKIWNRLFSSTPDNLYDAVPVEIRDDFRQALKQSSRYAYQYSLRKRLKELLASLDEPLQALVCEKPKDFVEKIVNERNYLTHLDKNSHEKRFDETKLIPLIRRLRILLTILLLKRLGIESKTIKENLQKNLPPWD